MSKESAAAFIDRASKDQDLYDRVVEAAGEVDAQGRQEYTRVVELAQAQGYDFTLAEFRQALRDYQDSLRAQSRELNDAELEAVAGGTKAASPSGYGPPS